MSEHLLTTPVEGDGAPSRSQEEELESVGEQEARHRKKQPTVPKDDPGLLPGGEAIGLYVLGLQEIVDINSAVEALRPFSDVATPGRFKKAVEKALPRGYELVAEQQLIGLLLLIWASPEVRPYVHSVSTTSVGTGLMGYMGNKGAVTARVVIGESTRLVFVNSHLGAGTGKTELERRHWDVAQIASRTRFDPITDGLGIVQEQGERIGDEDHAFWFGDLNYRLEGVPPDDVRKILMLHTRNEYDIGQKSQRKISKELSGSSGSSISSETSRTSTEGSRDDASSLSGASTKIGSNAEDPASLQATIDSLLPHDELMQSQKAGKAFADWKEGPITFLPTYKYDVGAVGVFDSGEKKRGPSWCDRILYRSRKDRLNYEEKLRAEKEARRRDDEMKKQGLDRAAEDESTMFEYDPEQDADEDYLDPGSVPTPPNAEEAAAMPDDLVLEYYTPHQRVLSSDHKPLDAVFKLRYEAAVPELKSKVQQEVAKELDRLENEGRPVLTVVVDGSLHGDDPNFSGISFGHVRYDDPKMRSVTLANTGRVPAHFGFVSNQHTERETTAAKWLSVNLDIPSEKTNDTSKSGDDVWDHDVDCVFKLEPGETANVNLVSHVKDKDVVRRFNDGETMEDILILRVKDGRDHFLPVRGQWQQSVHGRTLDRLIRLPEGGVRALQNQRPEGSRERSTSGEVRWSAPKEIFRLTEAIENLAERIVAEWTMIGLNGQPPWLQHAGWPFVEEGWTLDEETRQGLRVDVNEALDSDRQLREVLAALPALHELEVLVDVLLDFLGNLEDGIVTPELWSQIEAKLGSKMVAAERKESVMESLSTARIHSASFILVTSMLGRVVQEVAAGYQATPPRSRANSELPHSPRVKVRRKTLDKDAMVASKQLMVKNMAAVFADVLVRVPEGDTIEGTEGKRRQLVEMFLEGEPG